MTIATLQTRPLAPHHARLAWAVALVSLAGTVPALAQSTGLTGSNPPAPVNNNQPSLALHLGYQHEGIYGLGAVTRMFAYNDSTWANLTSGRWMSPDGRSLSRADNNSLFLQIGTTYGSSSASDFNIPDLRGRSIMGEGQGPGMNNYARGQASGSSSTTLSVANLPEHDHSLFGGGFTQKTGGNQAFSNQQPARALNASISTQGLYPVRDGGPNSVSPESPFIGQVQFLSATPTSSTNSAPCDGRTIGYYQNAALFSIVGNYYGGDFNNCQIPDLRGRLAVATNNGTNGLTPRAIGDKFGVDSITLAESQMPEHDHTVSGQPNTGLTGGNAPIDNVQSSLALTYCIALGGVYPSSGGMADDYGYLGEIIAFAGNYTPGGFAACNGQLLSIADNYPLFTLIGTTYGGDGINSFAVPDLRGRTVVGAWDDLPAGTMFGTETETLGLSQLPAHDHLLPSPGTVTLLGMGTLIAGRRRR